MVLQIIQKRKKRKDIVNGYLSKWRFGDERRGFSPKNGASLG
jgi:hypothetical protein